MKDVVVIIGTLNVGGAETHLSVILPELVKHGWSVTCVVLHGGGALQAVLQRNGVTVINILDATYAKSTKNLPRWLERPLRICLYVGLLTRELRKFSKDSILHFFLPESYILGMLSAMLVRFKGRKIMSRRSLNHYQQRRFWVASCEKFLHKKLYMASGNSQAVVDQLLAEGLPRERVRLIYNAANSAPFMVTSPRLQTRNTLHIDHDALVLIIVANLIPYKGHLDLLQALGAIKTMLPEKWRLLCVGRDDGICPALKLEAEKFELAEHVLWLGSRTDVADLLKAADIGILCSHEEGFSNAILEGMMVGLPMIVTDVGGNKEAVIDGETGLVVPAKNSAALSQAILKLASNPLQVQNFGLAGKRRVEQLFSLNACVQGYLNLYET